MKQLLAVFCVIVGFHFAFSQDIILLKNGDEIQSKVIEIENASIQYKKFDNLNGPTYSLLKTQVFMIRYENGTKEVYNMSSEQSSPAPEKALRATPNANSIAKHNYRKEIVSGAAMLGVGVPSLITGTILTAVGFKGYEEYDYYTGKYYSYTSPDLWITGLALMASGIALTIAGPIHLGKGIRHKRESKAGNAYLHFSPIGKRDFDKHFQSINVQKAFSVILNF